MTRLPHPTPTPVPAAVAAKLAGGKRLSSPLSLSFPTHFNPLSSQLFAIHWLHMALTVRISCPNFPSARTSSPAQPLCNFFSYRFSSYICLAFGSNIKSNQLRFHQHLPQLRLFMFLLLFPVVLAGLCLNNAAGNGNKVPL